MSTATASLEVTPQLESAVMDRIRQRATLYYPELAGSGLQMRLLGRAERASSTIFRCELRSAGVRRWIRIKLPSARYTAFPFALPMSPAERLGHEYAALTVLERHFQALNDGRFGAIRVLDLLSEYPAIVMEEVHAPTLRRLQLTAVRINPLSKPERIYRAFRHAGAWLRAFHALPAQEQANVTNADLSALSAGTEEYAAYLAERGYDRDFFRDLVRDFEREAGKYPSDPLSLLVEHGDFSPRNLFVGSGERITSCDTALRMVAPCYQDLAYFLVELRTNKLAIVTRGLAYAPQHLARCESEFLNGYFDGALVRHDMLRLFQVNVLLKKWATRVSYGDRASSLRQAVVSFMGSPREDRFFRRTLLDIWLAKDEISQSWRSRPAERKEGLFPTAGKF